MYIYTAEDHEVEQLEQIEYVKGLYDDQAQKVKNEQYICQLLYEDYVRAVRSMITRYDVIDFYSDAQDEIGNKAKSKRKNIDALTHMILSDFFGGDKEFKITKMVSCGYEGYAWRVELTGYGKTVYIQIPIKRKLTIENIEYANHGKFVFGEVESEFACKVLERCYRIEEMEQFITKYINSWKEKGAVECE